jgi:hypothetical protein
MDRIENLKQKLFVMDDRAIFIERLNISSANAKSENRRVVYHDY